MTAGHGSERKSGRVAIHMVSILVAFVVISQSACVGDLTGLELGSGSWGGGDYGPGWQPDSTRFCRGAPADTIVVGTVRDSLGPGNCTYPGSDIVARPYALVLEDSAVLGIRLRSNAFDPVLRVSDSMGIDIAYDDDGGGNLNASLVVAVGPGSYTIWATPYWSGTGPFELEVFMPALCTAGAAVATIAIGQSRTSSLTDSGCALLAHGWYARGYTLVLEERTPVVIDLTSQEFAPALIITDTLMALRSDSLSLGFVSARFSGTLDAGTYVVWVSSQQSWTRIGQYILSIPTTSAVVTLPGNSVNRPPVKQPRLR